MSRRRLLSVTLGACAATCAFVLPAAASADPVPLLQYGVGTSGGAAGQLDAPTGVAVGADGTVFVSEYLNARVSVFDADGTFRRAFGWDVIPGPPTGLEVCTTSCQPGSSGAGAGQLGGPTALALDPAGNVYVADAFDNRVSVYSPNGAFLRAFGFDVIPGPPAQYEVCTTSCQAGVSGGGVGQFSAPQSVAVAPGGTVYVADNGNQRISVFDPQPAFVHSFGWDVVPGPPVAFEVCTTSCQAATFGAGPAQLNNPIALAVDGTGNLQVAEFNNNRVSVYNSAPAFVRAVGFDVIPGGSAEVEACTVSCQAGVGGAGGGRLNGISGIAVSPTGELALGELAGKRISIFGPQPSFLRGFGFDVIPSGSTGFEVCTSSCKLGTAGNGFGQLDFVEDVAMDCRGAVFAADSMNDRILRFGEPGTQLAPCPGPPIPPDNPPTPPSNEFTIGKLQRNTKNGTAKLSVELPGAGEVGLSSKKAKPQTRQAEAAGEVKLKVAARGKAKEKLADSGAVKVKLAITFTPTGGASNTETTTAKLKRKGR